MDGNLIALLALFAFWLLGQLAKKKKPGQAESAPQDLATSDPELDDALAEIRRALGMEEPPPPQPSPAAFPEPIPVQDPVTRRPTTSDEFHRVVTGQPDFEAKFESRPAFESAKTTLEERFERSRPFQEANASSEDRFESKPAFDESFVSSESEFDSALEVFGDPLAEHDHVVIFDANDEPVVALPSGRLQSMADLREAFVLKEIVGPPRSLKPSIRG